MLYLFYGSDTDKARERASALLATLQKKKPEAELFRLDAEHWSEVMLDELIGGQGLFSKNYLVFLSHLFQNPDAEAVVLKKLSDIGESPNIFVMLEGKVVKENLLAITEAAKKVARYEKEEAKKKEFDVFSLTDAFGRRDKKNFWVLYQQAISEGVVPEQINGLLFWKVKSLLVSPYPNRQWSRDELKKLSAQFVVIYHDAHRGIHDFEIALERMILSL